MKKEYRCTRYFWVLAVMLISIVSFIEPVKADMGPKPALDIIVYGMDTEEYWLDLLVADENTHFKSDLSEQEKAKVSKLIHYKDKDNFHPALLCGTMVPLRGKLTGERQADGSYLHKFNYVGVPETFKIIILKKDGKLIISDIIKRSQYQSVMQYDLRGLNTEQNVITSAGKVSEKIPYTSFAQGFFLRLLATYMIEGIIALIFGFRTKKSFGIILMTNTITQVILNIIILFFTSSQGLVSGIFVFFLAECIVIITELIVYPLYLEEKGPGWCAVYALAANLASLIAGFKLFFIS